MTPVRAMTLGVLVPLACIGATAAQEPYQRGGLWQVQVTLDDLIVPGMPADEVERMKAAMAFDPAPLEICLSEIPAEAHPQIGDPVEFGAAGDCTYTAVERPGDAVARKGACRTGGGNDTDLTLIGSVAPDAYAMTARVEGKEADAIIVIMTERGQRLGECPAHMETAE